VENEAGIERGVEEEAILDRCVVREREKYRGGLAGSLRDGRREGT
jgi:hypothetical protein